MFNHRFENGVGDEGQGSLRADHQVSHDVDGILVIDQGIETVPGGVLYLEFVPDPLGQLSVGQHLLPEGAQTVEQPAMALFELIDGSIIPGIDHGAVDQYQPQRRYGAVTVLFHAAAHAAGIVG